MMPFRRRYRRSLRVQLVAVVLLGLLPIAGLLAFLWIGARARDRDETLLILTQTTEAVGVIADSLFDEGIALGQAIATDAQVRTLDPALFMPRLRELHERYPHYPNIVVLDASGSVLGWSSPEPLPSPAPSVATRPFFINVIRTGRPATIRVMDGQDAATLGSGVAVPISAPDGAVTGVVGITFDPAHVGSRLTQVRLFPGQVLSLIDPNGQLAVLAGSINQSAVSMTREQRDRSEVPEVRAALTGQVVTSTDFRSTVVTPSGGEQRLAAFVATSRHGWVLGVTWPVAEALAPTRQAELRELTIFGAIVLVILAGALVTSRALIAPLRHLSEHTRQLGDGRFVPIPQTHADDEIGELTGAFNAMGKRLQQTLNALRQERGLLEAVLRQLPVGVVIRAAPGGEIILGNAEAERVWNVRFSPGTLHDAAGASQGFYADGRPYPDDDAWPIFRALRTGEHVHYEEITVQRPDGAEGVVASRAAPVRDADGQIVAAVASHEDVTERHRMEARLREREELLRALLDQFPASVAVLDRELRYVQVAGRRILETGLASERLVGRTLAELYSEQLVATAAQHAERAFAGEMTAYDIIEQGTCLQVTMLPLRDANGQIVNILSLAFDVTAERERQDRQVRDEKLHALGQMAGGIAHNLNQMLTLVAGYGELARDALDREPPDHAELRRMIRIIERAAYDGGETVRRLLTFARGHGVERHQQVDVAALLHEVQQLTAPRWRDADRIEGRPMELLVEAEAGVTLVGSQADLREAITNLVLNALDAMPEGGMIRLSARRAGDLVLIDVVDTGTGMTPEVRRQIFEPFFTTKGEHGTGLGLPMVFGIVRRHAGQIDVSSALGQGTTVHLRLPAGAEAVAGSAGDRSQPAVPSHLQVLMVDDEAQLAALAAGMLRRDGHVVTEANSGEQALEQINAQPFDLVISDLSMGEGMNGWDLAAAVGQVVPGLPVVLVTGWGAALDEDEARSRGIRAILAKPFRIADLREMVARVTAGQPRSGSGRSTL